ncbi:hypothetical protein ABK040_009517 [Willaertia magna]
MAERRNLKKVIIPIAGHGTRMFPASKVIPKALFPIVDPKDKLCKPILQVIIEETVDALLSEQTNLSVNDIEICIVLQETQKPLIEQFFFEEAPFSMNNKPIELQNSMKRISQIGKRLKLVVQKEQLGFGHAVLCCWETFITDPNEPFLVLLGDHVYTSRTKSGLSCLQYMIRTYNKYQKGVVSLSTIVEDETPSNGVLKMGDIIENINNEALITSLVTTVEKPTEEQCNTHALYLTDKEFKELNIKQQEKRQLLCYFGIDILTPKVFDELKSNWEKKVFHKGELNLRDGMRPIIEEDGMVGIYVQATSRHDTGMPLEYLQTLNDYFNQNI